MLQLFEIDDTRPFTYWFKISDYNNSKIVSVIVMVTETLTRKKKLIKLFKNSTIKIKVEML